MQAEIRKYIMSPPCRHNITLGLRPLLLSLRLSASAVGRIEPEQTTAMSTATAEPERPFRAHALDLAVPVVALYVVWYNFVRVHKTLRLSPAMAAG